MCVCVCVCVRLTSDANLTLLPTPIAAVFKPRSKKELREAVITCTPAEDGPSDMGSDMRSNTG